MNTSRFRSDKDTFNVLDLTAVFDFKTDSSVSFTLERYSRSLLPTRMMGWIDLHHPCAGHIKLRVRIALPAEYHTPEKLREIARAALDALGVPPDETWEADLCAVTATTVMAQPVDREGFTDRLDSRGGGEVWPRT